MASEGAATASDAVLMALTATMEGAADGLVQAVVSCYPHLAEGYEGMTAAEALEESGRRAGVTIAGHIELELLLLTRLVQLTGQPPDALLRDALGR